MREAKVTPMWADVHVELKAAQRDFASTKTVLETATEDYERAFRRLLDATDAVDAIVNAPPPEHP